MDRRRKVVNFHESVSERILTVAASWNGAKVYTKLRIADALEIRDSGLDADLYSYALKAHFDFVVTDDNDMPLFAVEFDGPQHDLDEVSRANDRRKNAIAEKLGLPLARVRDEHIFQKPRWGVDYLTWFAELYFGYKALERAQQQGVLPEDDGLDPMWFLTHPHIPGRWPMMPGQEARIALRRHYRERHIDSAIPFDISGYSPTGEATTVLLLTAGSDILTASATVYLQGFGVGPHDVSEEIAFVRLSGMVDAHLDGQPVAVQPEVLRQHFIHFLRSNTWAFSPMGAPKFNIGFTLGVPQQNEGGRRWLVGAFGDEPEVVIPETR